jgi:hypothetical protein
VNPARAGTSAVVAVLAGAGLLLVLVTWAASIGPDRVLSGGHVEAIQPDEPTFATQTSNPGPLQFDQDPKNHRSESPGWVRTVAFLLELLTLGVVLFLLARLVRRARQLWQARSRRARAPVEEVEFEVLGSAGRVSEAIEQDAVEQRTLLEHGEPRNAIVACWDRFERQASRGGVVRQPWQTTGEYVLGVLDLVGADHGAVGRLADLYREARFSDHPMTESHRRTALDALDTIHRSLATNRAVTG